MYHPFWGRDVSGALVRVIIGCKGGQDCQPIEHLDREENLNQVSEFIADKQYKHSAQQNTVHSQENLCCCCCARACVCVCVPTCW